MRIEKINSGIQKKQNLQNNQTRPTFQRNWSEHLSWGANYFKETGKTNFKLFSFPDAKAVFVEVGKNISEGFGAIRDRVVQILATAGTALTVKNVLPNDDKSSVYPMDNKGDGVYEKTDVDAKPGMPYRYIVVDKDNNINLVKDPYAKKQENINGWSTIYDADNYKWENTDWLEGKDPRRIVRKPNELQRGLEGLVIDEINIPTLSEEGDFETAKKRIDVIAKRGVATAVELLPVENTFSKQWGYDGVDKFAVNEKLGGAEQLKSLVDYAHGKGLNVIMDMVPNHMGPDGDYLAQTGPYEKGSGQFGGEFNYEGQNNRYVRDWMANAALWWANEFKVDGLRLDMTKLCGSDYLLKQIVTEVNEHNPKVFIIAEDGRENKESVTRYVDAPISHKEELDFIDTQVDFIANKGWRSTPVNIGFDSEWDFRLMHTIKNAVLAPGANLLDDLDNRLKASQHRVKYVMSHDEIGNEDGTRLIPKVMVRQLNLFVKSKGNSDAEKGQNAARAGQKLAELVVSKDFATMDDTKLALAERNLGINDFISKDDLTNAFMTAIAKQKLALGTVLTIPGPKMYFQGDDEADLSNFKFFREFSGEKQQRAKDPNFANRIVAEKGYDTLESVARPDSILGRVKPEGLFKNIATQIETFSKDMAKLLQEIPALKSGDIVGTYKDNNHNVHIHHLKLGKDEALVIKNFGQGFHYKNYEYYGFPQNGNWKEVFNSDAKEYGGSGYSNGNREAITNMNQSLSLAPNSIVILKKVK